MEQKTFMQLGAIRYKFTTKERIHVQCIPYYIYPRFTRFIELNQDELELNDLYQLIIQNDIRNKQILLDIEECMLDNRTPLVITKFREHAQYFYHQLQNKYNHVLLLIGGKGNKKNKIIRERLKNIQEYESIRYVIYNCTYFCRK